MVSDPEIPNEWLEGLRRAARRFPDGDPYRHVFLEFRKDLRVRIHSRGTSEIVPTRTAGAVARGRGSAAYRSNPEPGDLERLVRAVQDNQGSWPGERTTPAPGFLDSEDDPTPLLDGLVARATRAAGSGAWAAASWASFDQRVAIVRGGGDAFTDRRTGCRLRLEVRIVRSGRQASAVGDRILRRGITDDSIAGLEVAVARRAEERLEAARADEGNVAAVFARGTGGVLIHEIVGHALEADGVDEGESLLAAHAAPVASTLVSVVDDPRRGRGAWTIDDEGNEARATALLQMGRVVGRMTDQGSGVRCTGHGRRASYRDPVRPRMGCTFLAPGPSRAEDIVASTDRGVFVRRMEAAANDPATGIAVFRVSDADRILAGRHVTPLAPFLLQVSVLRALGTLDAVGDDLEFDTCIGTCLRDGQPLAVSVGAPTFRIGVVRVHS